MHLGLCLSINTVRPLHCSASAVRIMPKRKEILLDHGLSLATHVCTVYWVARARCYQLGQGRKLLDHITLAASIPAVSAAELLDACTAGQI